jgi:hypothetical protein
MVDYVMAHQQRVVQDLQLRNHPRLTHRLALALALAFLALVGCSSPTAHQSNPLVGLTMERENVRGEQSTTFEWEWGSKGGWQFDTHFKETIDAIPRHVRHTEGRYQVESCSHLWECDYQIERFGGWAITEDDTSSVKPDLWKGITVSVGERTVDFSGSIYIIIGRK